MNTSQRIIVVGAGVAGARATEAIRARFDGELLMLGADVEAPYHRPVVSKEILRGESLTAEQLWVYEPDWWRERGIVLRTGTFATGLWPDEQELWLHTGEAIAFDRLVVATGSIPRRLNVPGSSLPGVTTLRTLADGRALAQRLVPGRKLVVIGAGVLGVEVATTALTLGLEVTVIERGLHALARVAGPLASPRLTNWLTHRGLGLRSSSNVKRVLGDEAVVGVELTTGEQLPADLVVVATGVVPATSWLEGSGVALHDDAVMVDEYGRTSHPRVFAAGEVASAWVPTMQRRVRVEHYGWAWQHGELVGRNVTGDAAAFNGVPSGSADIWGRRLQFSGDLADADYSLVESEDATGRFAMLLFRDSRVCGVVALDSAAAFARLRRTIGSPGPTATQGQLGAP